MVRALEYSWYPWKVLNGVPQILDGDLPRPMIERSWEKQAHAQACVNKVQTDPDKNQNFAEKRNLSFAKHFASCSCVKNITIPCPKRSDNRYETCLWRQVKSIVPQFMLPETNISKPVLQTLSIRVVLFCTVCFNLKVDLQVSVGNNMWHPFVTVPSNPPEPASKNSLITENEPGMNSLHATLYKSAECFRKGTPVWVVYYKTKVKGVVCDNRLKENQGNILTTILNLNFVDGRKKSLLLIYEIKIVESEMAGFPE